METCSKNKVRVILADDDIEIRHTLSQFLVQEQYTIVGQAADGMDTVKLCRSLHPDLVLMDIKMPLMDGISAAKLISQERSAHCIVMLTAFYDCGFIDKAIVAGAHGYLLKPIKQESVLPALEIALARSKDFHLIRKQQETIQTQLDNRKVIDQAKLCLMESRQLTESAAYELIRTLSRRKQVSMKQVSEFILTKMEYQS
ncbi:response regulator [Oscillospiraceae bacterium PP1C4]